MTFSDPGDDIPASSFVKVDCTAKRKRMDNLRAQKSLDMEQFCSSGTVSAAEDRRMGKGAQKPHFLLHVCIKTAACKWTISRKKVARLVRQNRARESQV